MDKLRQKIKKKVALFHEINRVKKHLAQLDIRIANERKQLEQILATLAKENQDIEALEKWSIKSIFYHVLGDKEKQLEKERQEYLQTSLKYDEHRKTIELLEFEQGILQKKIDKSNLLESEINQLIEQRKKELLNSNQIIGKQLVKLTSNIEQHRKLVVDMEEAVNAGNKALYVLSQMIQSLQQAKNWGNWDLVSNERMSDYLKHSRLDTARQLSYQAKQLLMRFEDELGDVYEKEQTQFDFSLNFNSFSSFTDIFMDNLISDWIIQQKISNSLSSVISTRDRVTRVVSFLEKDIPKAQDEIEKLEKQKADLIVNS